MRTVVSDRPDRPIATRGERDRSAAIRLLIVLNRTPGSATQSPLPPSTARFLEEQRPGGSAFVIGEAGLTTALHQVATP
jgi:ribonucleotide monophosphatase NagD (HAD superfamily)